MNANPRVRATRIAITVAYVLLGIAYATATPIFEKNDEGLHFALARHLAQGGGLPIQQPDLKTTWEQEGSQPPLYYALIAPVVAAFDTSDMDVQMQPNAAPQYSPFAPDNKNKLIITPQKRAFDYRNTTAAAFALRLLSLIPGAVTVWFTFGLTRLLSNNDGIALLAMGLVTFNPMFLTISSAVSNDVMVVAFATAGMWLLAKCLVERMTMLRVIGLGIVCGLASLSKVSGALLLPVAAAALALHTLSVNHLSITNLRAYPFAFVMILAWASVAVWWYARNVLLYGELTGTMTMARVAGLRVDLPMDIAGELRGFVWTFLGIFGQTNVPFDPIVYGVFSVVLVIALAGFALFLAQQWKRLDEGRRMLIGAIAAHVLLVFISIAYWTQFTAASHGRLLFPAIAGLAAFGAIGIHELLTRFGLGRAAPAAMLPLAALAVIAPFVVIAPVYRPPLISVMPGDAIPAGQRLAPYAEVLGYHTTPREARPGDTVRLEVFMRALQPTQSNFRFVTTVFGRDTAPLVRLETFNGGGLLPSSEWQPGQMWREAMDIRIPNTAIAPAILKAQFDLFQPYFGEFAQSTDAAGNPGAPLFKGSTLMPPTQPQSGTLATFGDLAALVSVSHTQPRAGAPMTITLRWQPLKQGDRDYTIFVHVLDANGNLVLQDDAPPDGGQFPTSRWAAGAAFDDAHMLTLPLDMAPGLYHLMGGFYDAQTGQRLPVRRPDGPQSPDAAFEIGSLDMK